MDSVVFNLKSRLLHKNVKLYAFNLSFFIHIFYNKKLKTDISVYVCNVLKGAWGMQIN